MKMTRKLIPAFVMLIVSAIMLSTASYAWLAESTSVSAGPMTVKANTDVVFMQISNDKSDWGRSAIATTAESGYLDLITATVTDDQVSWKTAKADSPENAAASGEYESVTDDDKIKSQYTLFNTFYVKMSNAESELQNLKISGVALGENEEIAEDAFDEALRVLVIASNEAGDTVHGIQIWDLGTGDFLEDAEGNTVGDDVLADSVTNEIIMLSVYIYYDGDDERAFTNNLSSAETKNLTVSFDAEQVTQ